MLLFFHSPLGVSGLVEFYVLFSLGIFPVFVFLMLLLLLVGWLGGIIIIIIIIIITIIICKTIY